MKLAVEVLNDSIVLDVDSNDRVKLVKYLVRERKGIEMSDQMLLLGGQLLKDHSKLADYANIVDGSTIRMVLADNYYRESGMSNDIKVTVEVFEEGKGKAAAFEVDARLSDSVKELKVRIESKKAIPANRQVLWFGDVLENDLALSDYDIRNESTLSLSTFTCDSNTVDSKNINSFDIFIRMANGRVLCQQIKTYWSIGQTVKIIRESKGEEAGRMLVLKGRVLLRGSRYLFDYDIEEDSTLDLIDGLPAGSMMIGVQFSGKEQQAIRSNVREVLNRAPNLTHFDYLTLMNPATRFFVLIVKSSERIGDVKTAIEGIKSAVCGANADPNINASQLVLKSMHDQEMDDECSLSDYGIENNSVIGLLFKLKIVVKSYDDGRILRLDVRSNDTCEEIEAEIERQTQIPAAHQTISNSHCDYNYFSFELIRYRTVEELIEGGARSVFGLEVRELFRISVTVPGDYGDSKNLDVRSTDLIEEVKRMIEQQQHIPLDQQRLSFEGQQLADGHTLAHYGVQDQSALYLILKVNNMELSVKTFDDQTHELTVEFDDTIEVVKSKIEHHLYPAEQLILKHRDEPLDDYRTLSSYRIGDGSVLSLDLKLIDLEIEVKTECVEKKRFMIKSSCSVQELKDTIKNSDLSICKHNELTLTGLSHHPSSTVVVYKENALILGRDCRIKSGSTLFARQEQVCGSCAGCSKIEQFKKLTRDYFLH